MLRRRIALTEKRDMLGDILAEVGKVLEALDESELGAVGRVDVKGRVAYSSICGRRCEAWRG